MVVYTKVDYVNNYGADVFTDLKWQTLRQTRDYYEATLV